MREGKKDGRGIFYHSNFGLKYKGDFNNDLAHGVGTLKFVTGHKIKTAFNRGKIEDSNAMIRYKDIGIYNGEIKGGMRDGHGTMEYFAEGVYQGN